MARIRTVKPEHWNDKQLKDISLQAHLFWIGTWNFSDDEGIFESDPFLLRSQVFPRRTDIRIDQIEQWLNQLEKAGFIIRFNHNDVDYFITRTFKAHQRIDRPTPSKVPDDVIRRILVEPSRPLDLYRSVEDSKVKECIVAFVPPSSSDVIEYFIKNGYSEPVAQRAFDYYESAGWKDGNGKQVINWKQKMISVWFKEEHKTKTAKRVGPYL